MYLIIHKLDFFKEKNAFNIHFRTTDMYESIIFY